MKTFGALAFLLLLSIFPSPAMASDTVVKTFCTQAIGYESLDKLKADLLTNAKRLAVDELFGELIAASTTVENFVVTTDQIRTSSLGLVRIEGTAEYRNGANLAEVCVTLRAYATEQDKGKFKPIKLAKRHCVTNSDLTTKQLTSFGKEEAVVQALLDYDRRLEEEDRKSLLRLMQNVTYLESGFIPDTETFCARVEGYIVPIEIIALSEQAGMVNESNFEVLATLPWQSTGVQVRKGDKLEIKYLSGTWTETLDATPRTDPAGIFPSPEFDWCRLPMSHKQTGKNALVGKIGDNAPFKVGKYFSTAAAAEGILYLALNDCDQYLSDNAGSVTVSIKTSR